MNFFDVVVKLFGCLIMFYLLYNHYKYNNVRTNLTAKKRFYIEYTNNPTKFNTISTLLIRKFK